MKIKNNITDNPILTKWQKKFLLAFAASELSDIYSFAGGTAISAFFLEHRLSHDLDFFSSEKVSFYIPENFIKSLDFVKKAHFLKKFDRNIFNLELIDNSILKTEFSYYPIKRINDLCIQESLKIESFVDLLVNKLCAIADRIDIKDFFDVYWAVKSKPDLLHKLIDLSEDKCEISGISHVLQYRFLHIPKGLMELDLKVEVNEYEIENFFENFVRNIVRVKKKNLLKGVTFEYKA